MDVLESDTIEEEVSVLPSQDQVSIVYTKAQSQSDVNQ
jgi:hypothetical protein